MGMNVKTIRILETGLFITGCVGVVVSSVLAVRDGMKADKILHEARTVLKPGEDPESVPTYYHINENGHKESQVIVTTDTKKEYYTEVIKATWKCYIPTLVSTTATITMLVVSNRLTAKRLALLSSAVAGAGSLVSKYRNEIRQELGAEKLKEIDRKIAADEITKAKPPVITTSGFLSSEEMDLSYDGEFIFFDPFTKQKFKSTKLAVLGAKYYLNRNFALGGSVPLSMFYSFLGIALPEEYSHCQWDISEMEDSGFYWIDLDIVRSSNVDPETGEHYYILEYGVDPGEIEESFYPLGNPMITDGSTSA